MCSIYDITGPFIFLVEAYIFFIFHSVTGYAIGSFLGGISYSYLGKSQTFQLFAAISLLCGIMHVLLQETVLKQKLTPQEAKQMQYKSPDDAIKTTNGIA